MEVIFVRELAPEASLRGGAIVCDASDGVGWAAACRILRRSSTLECMILGIGAGSAIS